MRTDSKQKQDDKGPIVYYIPGGAGVLVGGGGVQFLKRVNSGGSVLKMYKV